jgi:hypothetical protein
VIAAETKELGILARWYAEPLSHEEAEQLLSLAEKREQERLKRFARSNLSPFLRLIALHWLGEPTEEYYRHLTSRRTASIHAEILKPMIYGQLLMSRKTDGAMAYLDDAFHRARLLLRPEDYFVLMKRHQVLRSIPLSAEAAKGERLEGLLRMGGVIDRMEQGRGERPEFRHDPDDTYG